MMLEINVKKGARFAGIVGDRRCCVALENRLYRRLAVSLQDDDRPANLASVSVWLGDALAVWPEYDPHRNLAAQATRLAIAHVLDWERAHHWENADDYDVDTNERYWIK
ncbi:hypothetical protein [Ferrovum myxofaciens]|uniref:hypothetical protein n=1 Tax=Ferrovum myxofaciens TaxID=416213 RepID=UPI002354835F|nr:hypothetical protein [Ferrovum myxofaciens]MBU6994039.1 hypothetical protein [Ferrovum myxofaciens]MBU6995844.1 hypothetical protein [Ferrovum myxofaciens]